MFCDQDWGFKLLCAFVMFVFFPVFPVLFMFFDEPKQENAVSIGLTSPLSENIFSSFEFILIWKLCFLMFLPLQSLYPGCGPGCGAQLLSIHCAMVQVWGYKLLCRNISFGGGFVNPENWSCLTSWTDPLDANLFHVMNLLFAQCKSFREIGSRISNPYMLNPRKHLSIW